MALVENQCTLLLSGGGKSDTKLEDIKKAMESNKDEDKITAMQEVIFRMLSGEKLSGLLMHVIKFCLRSSNHTLKKMLLLYWEIVEKKNSNGKLKEEMILVCNALLQDLQHANEYVRGSTLRLLCKFKEPEILEPLKQAITANLKHKHAYVRKNAVLAIFQIYEKSHDIFPDAVQMVEDFIAEESDESAKRNAFLMLFHCDQDAAINFLAQEIGKITQTGEAFQMVVLELIRKMCRQGPLDYNDYLHYQKCVNELMHSPSKTVSYEAANTILSISALGNSARAARSAVSAMTDILVSESDNNVRLIILERLQVLKKRHERTLQAGAMDILKAVSSPNTDIRKKTLELVLELTCNRNIEDITEFLKKEIVSTEMSDDPNKLTYRTLLVETIHKCAVKFPDVAASVVHVLMNYLGDEHSNSARDVVYFVREIVEEYPKLRGSIISKLLESFSEINSSQVYRVALWILGEYAEDADTCKQAFEVIEEGVGALPLVAKPEAVEKEAEDEEKKDDAQSTAPSSRIVILPDGTYSTQTVTPDADASDKKLKPDGVRNVTLRSLLMKGDYFLGAALANAYTKLVLRYKELTGDGSPESNKAMGQGILLIAAILRLGTSKIAVKKIDKDSQSRITLCLRTLLSPGPLKRVFLKQAREAFAQMLVERKASEEEEKKEDSKTPVKQADDLIVIRQLCGPQFSDVNDEDDEVNLTKALGSNVGESDFSSRMNKVKQLTGLSDPVYAETYVAVHEYDIVLDILVINQTDKTLQNLAVELSTHGDLKVVERPQTYTLAPHASQKIRASIKVSSTENGTIFGNIVYNTSGASSDPEIIILNSIHMDVGDYIAPATCSASEFTDHWAEFEWENKVPITTDIKDLNEYLNHIVSITNMRCLTPQRTLEGKSEFLAANLFARSIFAEDALLNLSVEYSKTGRLGGYIRIRSKTQGIARSLGDKIQAQQRSLDQKKEIRIN